MADLGKTQAQWTKAVGEVLAQSCLAPVALMESIARTFSLERERALTLQDVPAASGSLATITGAKPGTNLDPQGYGYVRIADAGGGNWTVSIYSAAGASGLVAQGTGAQGGTVSLTAQNSSGLSATWTLPASPAVVASDGLRILAFVDKRKALPRVFDGTDSDDFHARDVLSAASLAVASGFTAARNAFVGAFSRALLSDGQRNNRAWLNEFMSLGRAQFIAESRTPDDDDNLVRYRTGALEDLFSAMEDETTGGAQSVIKRVVAVASTTFDASNDGSGSITWETPLESAQACTVRAECVDETLGAETFDGDITITEDDSERVIPFSGWRIHKSFALPNGLSGVLERTYSKTGDNSHVNFANPSTTAPSITGENSQNTSAGTLYWRVTAEGGSLFTYELHKSSTRTAQTLVGKATGIAAAEAFTFTPFNGGPAVAWTAGSAPNGGDTGTLVLNPFKSQRSADGKPDSWTASVTLTAGAGLIQTLIGLVFRGGNSGAFLKSATSGSETIEDGHAKVGLYPYDELDY